MCIFRGIKEIIQYEGFNFSFFFFNYVKNKYERNIINVYKVLYLFFFLVFKEKNDISFERVMIYRNGKCVNNSWFKIGLLLNYFVKFRFVN